MSNTLTQTPDQMTITEDDIKDFLKENPSFLQENPDVFEALIPEKKRGMRGQPADFQAYVIDRLKNDKDEIIESTRELVENARSNMNNQARIHEAVLRILDANNFNDFIQCLTMDMASILDVDIAVLVVEADGNSIPHINNNGIRIIPEGTVDNWMEGQPVLLQSDIGGLEAIYGSGASLVKSQILLRLDISADTPPAILAFGSREPHMFNENQATDQILFFARVIERILRIWLDIPE